MIESRAYSLCIQLALAVYRACSFVYGHFTVDSLGALFYGFSDAILRHDAVEILSDFGADFEHGCTCHLWLVCVRS